MATTLVVFVGTRLSVTYWVRPHFVAPSHTSASFASATNLGFEVQGSSSQVTFVAGPPNLPDAWVYSDRIVDSAGHAVTRQALHAFLHRACPGIVAPPRQVPAGTTAHAGNPAAFNDCVAKLSARFHETVTYQPAGRFWTFQSFETATYLGLALILTGISFWWVRRRLT